MAPFRPAGTLEPMEDETATSSLETPAGISFDLFCQKCGYNLRGNVSGVCSECGEAA